MKYAFAAAALVSAVVAAPGAPAAYGTSTVEVTTEVTITSCAAWVTDCPGAPASSVAAYSTASVVVAPSSGVPSAYPSVSVVASAEPSSYPSGSWGAPPAYSTPVESSPVASSPVASYPATTGWGSAPAPYPSSPVETYPATSAGWGAAPTGTAVVYPSSTPTGWAPVPATGSGATVRTGGLLAAAGALFALFL